MKTRVTMRDVARAAGVSPMTVSRALKDDGFVNIKTRKVVREAAHRLGYVYDTTALAFRAQKSGFLAVTLPSINNANFAATHRGLRRALTDYRLEEEERLVRNLMARRPDAVVLTGGMHTPTTRALVEAAGIPVIEIWDQPQKPLGHVVGLSNADAMGLVVKHLADTGRRRLAFIGATRDTDRRGAERRRGAEAMAKALGLPKLRMLDAGDAPVTMPHGAKALTANKDLLGQIDGILCVSDPVAFGAISAATGMGIRIPEDLAITGFGAFEIAGYSMPKITTVGVRAAHIGTEAGRILTSLDDTPASATPQQKVDTGSALLKGGSS